MKLIDKLNSILEGINDPGIFKAIFLAGGPGSGKSFVAGRTTAGLGLKIVNSDDLFEYLLKQKNLSTKLDTISQEQMAQVTAVRDTAKLKTARKQKIYIKGRLGLVIDGTGKSPDKISRQKQELERLGYDCYMIFVNTSLEVALARNQNRARTVPEKIVTHSWNKVQNNIGVFQRLFGSSSFSIVDNNDAKEDVFVMVWKRVKKFVSRPVDNYIAKAWIENQRAARGLK